MSQVSKRADAVSVGDFWRRIGELLDELHSKIEEIKKMTEFYP